MKRPIEQERGAHRVAVIGSGSWGTVVAKIIAENVAKDSMFDSRVDMWTFEETLSDGRLLSHVINTQHENVKYMPGLRLPPTVRAVTSVEETVRDASHLVFVVPHQVRAKETRKKISLPLEFFMFWFSFSSEL